MSLWRPWSPNLCQLIIPSKLVSYHILYFIWQNKFMKEIMLGPAWEPSGCCFNHTILYGKVSKVLTQRSSQTVSMNRAGCLNNQPSDQPWTDFSDELSCQIDSLKSTRSTMALVSFWSHQPGPQRSKEIGKTTKLTKFIFHRHAHISLSPKQAPFPKHMVTPPAYTKPPSGDWITWNMARPVQRGIHMWPTFKSLIAQTVNKQSHI